MQVHQCAVRIIELVNRIVRQAGQHGNRVSTTLGRQLAQQSLLERGEITALLLDVSQGRKRDRVLRCKVECLAESRGGAIGVGQGPGLEHADANVERRTLGVVLDHLRLVGQRLDQTIELARLLIQARQLVEGLQVGLVTLTPRLPGSDGQRDIATIFVQPSSLSKERQPARRIQFQRPTPLQDRSQVLPINPATIERLQRL